MAAAAAFSTCAAYITDQLGIVASNISVPFKLPSAFGIVKELVKVSKSI
jgi:hypothetical protein